MLQSFSLSIRQACRALSLSSMVYHNRPDMLCDEPVIAALQQAAERYPCYVFRYRVAGAMR
ncbi:hypothetical protein EHW66_18560 [Erwinia psidii]|nr:hypothetical protein [Erwinia psidii]MCX8963151.1 hypothetical protein [Erwinia psidii]MCX8966907.1 hypothetical protein [Erwinia psidii]